MPAQHFAGVCLVLFCSVLHNKISCSNGRSNYQNAFCNAVKNYGGKQCCNPHKALLHYPLVVPLVGGQFLFRWCPLV